ncbi:MAG: PEP-CTERM sorting domain-containing protein [Terriglobales bacterium]
MKTKLLILAAALFGLAVGASAGTLGIITNASQFQASNTITWTSGESIGVPLTTVGGRSVYLSSDGTLTATDESTFGGNFNSGDGLLQTSGTQITFSFDAPISGFGTWFQLNDFKPNNAGLPFTAVIDASGNEDPEYTENGLSTAAGTGSAIFLGFQDATPDIHNVTLSVEPNVLTDSFLIDSVEVNTGSVTATPEPATWLLLATGLLGLAFYERKRRLARARPESSLP